MKKMSVDDSQHYGHDRDVGTDAREALHGGGYCDGRGDNAVGNERTGTDDATIYSQCLPRFADECIESEDSSLSFIIRLEGDTNIFYGSLKGQRPDDARHCAEDIVSIKAHVGVHDALHHIEWRGADVRRIQCPM
jgi:hypothetical protein